MKDSFIIPRWIILSTRYLRLSPSAQSLYIALHADADDDGIVEVFAVMLRQRATENDVIQLIDNNFIVLIDKSNLIAWVRDWLGANLGRDMRYIKPSKYRILLARIVPEAEVFIIKQNDKGKKYREIVPVTIAMKESELNTKQQQLLTRRIPPPKSSQAKPSNNTWLGISNSNIYTCPECQGKGTVDNELCPICNGKGIIEYNKKERSK